MTPIPQEPKGLEPRGCEGDESLGAESDGCREGDSLTSKKEGKRERGKNQRERGYSIPSVENCSGAAQIVCSCSSVTEEAPALISVFIFPWGSTNCISI